MASMITQTTTTTTTTNDNDNNNDCNDDSIPNNGNIG